MLVKEDATGVWDYYTYKLMRKSFDLKIQVWALITAVILSKQNKLR